VMVAALLLQIVKSYATQTAARGSAILTVDVLNMLLISVLVFLVLRQVMPIASALAGGVSLNSFGVISRSVRWAMPERRKDSASKATGTNAERYSGGGVSISFRDSWRRFAGRNPERSKAVDSSSYLQGG
jgi:type IV secretion system protein VirB6